MAKLTEVNPLQPIKAELPILITDDGIVTDVSPENRVRCSWITKRGNRNTEIFHTFELEHEE